MATSERLAPDAIASSTNLSGAVADIDDDPDSPDGSWLTTTSGGASQLRVGFPTPGNTLTDLNQEFRLLVRVNASSGNAVSFTVELYEGGVLNSTLGTVSSFTSTTGTVYSYTFTKSALTTQSGADVELRINQTGGATGQTQNRRYLEIGAVEWNASINETASVSSSESLTASDAISATVQSPIPAALTEAVTAGESTVSGVAFSAAAGEATSAADAVSAVQTAFGFNFEQPSGDLVVAADTRPLGSGGASFGPGDFAEGGVRFIAGASGSLGWMRLGISRGGSGTAGRVGTAELWSLASNSLTAALGTKLATVNVPIEAVPVAGPDGGNLLVNWAGVGGASVAVGNYYALVLNNGTWDDTVNIRTPTALRIASFARSYGDAGICTICQLADTTLDAQTVDGDIVVAAQAEVGSADAAANSERLISSAAVEEVDVADEQAATTEILVTASEEAFAAEDVQADAAQSAEVEAISAALATQIARLDSFAANDEVVHVTDEQDATLPLAVATYNYVWTRRRRIR